jgi:NADH-quinone oxidoreductase subunit H
LEFLDQLFVNLKHWAVRLFPEDWQPWVSILASIVGIVVVFPFLFAITTVIERKGLGRIQNRLGPNRVGPFGFLQFAADGLKMLTKEDVVPRAADKVLHFLAPVLLVVPVFLAYSVLPLGRNMVAIDIDAGLLFFFAVGAVTEVVIFTAGWSSRNKYSLLGAMRAVAQMISYEMPLVISALTVVMLVGSLSLTAIVAEQQTVLFGFLHAWHVFTPWGLAGFFLFMVSATAEANRTPFDLPEAESELVAGYFTEYSGFKFALFFLAEYLGLFAISGLAITLFLGGWTAPFTFLDWIPSWLCFFLKLAGMVALFIWLRGTLPRLRTDQLMNFAWKFMLPMTFINLVVAALWHYSASWNLPAHLLVRWIICAAVLVIPYVLFGRGFEPHFAKRTYRYAE